MGILTLRSIYTGEDGVIFKPIALVCSIKVNITRVANVEISKESTILHIIEIEGHEILDIDTNSVPIQDIGSRCFVRDKEESIKA